ncbi:hypothetical protein pETSU_167 [Edwardsiella phage pEt-SU]|uniref:Uncharacterized protein n=1 Tax=Edwardsiella phage pEt-SU TaxID=2562142 RepID=A0A4D6DX02_9CAUD|nr:hypothetical protein HOV39_gp167 [Edwardsiella phage pEt-SU]QBZ70748.1 hypothetical protein pETSU_167 [Edwardsiella phage pEt-SU]
MTMFANSSMIITVEDAIIGMEKLLADATEANRELAVSAYTKRLARMRTQTTEEFRKEMGWSVN